MILATNRTLIRIKFQEPIHHLRARCFPELPDYLSFRKPSEKSPSDIGYYLMDSPRGFGEQAPLHMASLAEIAPKIFSQELSELAIPNEMWPDVDDFSEFKRHFSIQFLPLIADLGSGPVITRKV